MALEIAFNLDRIDIISVSSPDKLFNYLSEWSAQISWEEAIWTRLHISVTQRLTPCLSTRTNKSLTHSLARWTRRRSLFPRNQTASPSDSTHAATHIRRPEALIRQRALGMCLGIDKSRFESKGILKAGFLIKRPANHQEKLCIVPETWLARFDTGTKSVQSTSRFTAEQTLPPRKEQSELSLPLKGQRRSWITPERALDSAECKHRRVQAW